MIKLHIPGYQYCGPEARGDLGINPLDIACKEHDVAYARNPNKLSDKHAANKILIEKARDRIIAKDANLDEKAAA